MQLRPYQEATLEKLADLTAKGVRAPLIVAPTGAGKTVIAAAIIQRAPMDRVLFLAPRRELIHQTNRKLEEIGVAHGIILAGDKRQSLYSRVQIASRDTLISRALRSKKITLPPFDRIIIDEAHIGLSERFKALLALWPTAQLIGLTATPCRSDGKALGQLYDEIIEVSTYQELTDLGYLVSARYFSVSEPDLRRVRTTAGEYNPKDLDGVMNRTELVGDIVEHWLRHASDRRTVVFATSIAHSVALCKEFLLHGVSAEHVDALTPHGLREEIFNRFRSGVTQVLTNCTLASVGFDLPELDCVVFARPTKSLGLYLQMLGRGLRPFTYSNGALSVAKHSCLVLDHAGNTHRHGFATDQRYWTLHGKFAIDEARTREAGKADAAEKPKVRLTCPVCRYVFESSRQCPNCNYWFPSKAKTLATIEGELVEIGPLTAKPSAEQRMHFYLELAGYGELKGYAAGWAGKSYEEKFGERPAPNWKAHVEKHGGMEPSLPVMRWVKSRTIAYARSQRKKAA